MFTLHPTLASDCFQMGKLSLCEVLLHNNATYPWLILVPQRTHITEIYDLSEEDQIQLHREISLTTKHLQAYTCADKMNIAAFGNQVPQLHIHIIARHHNDPAWPQPVWLHPAPTAYAPEQVLSWRLILKELLHLE